MLRIMGIRQLILFFVLLACASVSAGELDYDSARKGVEKECAATNTIPQSEQMFVGRCVPPRYAAIIRYHNGITIREILDQSPLKGRVVQVEVMRTEPTRTRHYTTRHYIRVGPSDKPDYELKSQDVIWLHDEGPIVNS